MPTHTCASRSCDRCLTPQPLLLLHSLRAPAAPPGPLGPGYLISKVQKLPQPGRQADLRCLQALLAPPCLADAVVAAGKLGRLPSRTAAARRTRASAVHPADKPAAGASSSSGKLLQQHNQWHLWQQVAMDRYGEDRVPDMLHVSPRTRTHTGCSPHFTPPRTQIDSPSRPLLASTCVRGVLEGTSAKGSSPDSSTGSSGRRMPSAGGGAAGGEVRNGC